MIPARVIIACRYRGAYGGACSSTHDGTVAIAKLVANDRANCAASGTANGGFNLVTRANRLRGANDCESSGDRPVLHGDVL